MDGQRRVGQPVKQAPKTYHRAHAKAKAVADARGGFAWRAFARVGALAFLSGSILMGLSAGKHLDYDGSPWKKMPGKLSGLVGLAADDVKISGLVLHEPSAVLASIGLQPGGSLVGFDASQARKLLENLDWVASAKVARMFPNQLDISLVERVPFAVWQRGGQHYVIDRSGSAISSVDPGRMPALLVVTGEGAQLAAAELVNQLEAHPGLKLEVRAASRVGQRRWNLHLDSGVVISLPEEGIGEALAEAEALNGESGLFGKGVSVIDLRVPGRTVVRPALQIEGAKEVKVSRRQ
jgi:cell division protein FtsQ